MTPERLAQVRALAAERAALARTASQAGDAANRWRSRLNAEVAYLDERLDELLRRLADRPRRRED
jgi:ABC-type transporter Mla subunit MlaD